MTRIPYFIEHLADNKPNDNCIIAGSQQLTFQMTNHRIVSIQNKLYIQGIRKGDRVALFSENSVEFVIILFALIRLGAIACPLSIRLPRETLVSQLNQIGSSWFISDVNMKSNIEDLSVNVLSFQAIFEETDRNGIDIELDRKCAYDLDQTATVIFSSGSTGEPKAIAHTVGNHYFNALGANENIPLMHGDRWLLSLPVYHVGGLAILFRCIIAGASIVIQSNRDITADVLKNNGITHISMVPTQLKRLLANQKSVACLRQLKCILLGGDIIDSGLINEIFSRELPVAATFGSTEMASQITTTRFQNIGNRLTTCGHVLKYRKMTIAEDHEICVKGKTLFKGFVKNGKLIKRQNDNEWYRTGDLGARDDNGCLSVFGRKDNMFISGGENIYPEEIERCLNSLECIDISVVIPVLDDEFGYRPVAFIKPAKRIPINQADIISEIQVQLPKFKIPTQFLEWPDAYQNVSLKLDRLYFKKLFHVSEEH